SLAAHAKRDLEQLGVQVITNKRVTRIERDAVFIGDERIPTRTVFWAAGNEASPLVKTLDAALDHAGRVLVQPDLSVPDQPNIFIVGDLAAVFLPDGKTLVPGVAPAANQEGATAARNILASINGQPRRPFRYRNKGDLATIGRHRAIANFGWLRLTGYVA